MKNPTEPKKGMRETGLRLYHDQLEKLDLLVNLCNGRKDRSHIIREAIDVYIDSKLSGLAT